MAFCAYVTGECHFEFPFHPSKPPLSLMSPRVAVSFLCLMSHYKYSTCGLTLVVISLSSKIPSEFPLMRPLLLLALLYVIYLGYTISSALDSFASNPRPPNTFPRRRGFNDRFSPVRRMDFTVTIPELTSHQLIAKSETVTLITFPDHNPPPNPCFLA